MDTPSWICAVWIAGIPIAAYIVYVAERVRIVQTSGTMPVQPETVFFCAFFWPPTLAVLCIFGILRLLCGVTEVAGRVLERTTDALVNRLASVDAKPQREADVLLRDVDGGKEREA